MVPCNQNQGGTHGKKKEKGELAAVSLQWKWIVSAREGKEWEEVRGVCKWGGRREERQPARRERKRGWGFMEKYGRGRDRGGVCRSGEEKEQAGIGIHFFLLYSRYLNFELPTPSFKANTFFQCEKKTEEERRRERATVCFVSHPCRSFSWFPFCSDSPLFSLFSARALELQILPAFPSPVSLLNCASVCLCLPFSLLGRGLK